MWEKNEFYSAAPEYLRGLEREGFIVFDGDMISFCDPVYGEPCGEKIPRSLLEDEIFCDGISTLQNLSQKDVSFTTLFNYHRGEEDVGPLQEQKYQLSDYKIIGLEWEAL